MSKSIRIIILAASLLLVALPLTAAENDSKSVKASVIDCLNYGASYMEQGEYDFARAWFDYGLKIYASNPQLTIARKSLQLLNADESKSGELIAEIQRLMLEAEIKAPNEALKKVLIYSGFYQSKMDVDGYLIINKVVYEMQASPVQLLYVGFMKKPLKMDPVGSIKIKSKNEWTAYLLIKNNSDIDFSRKNKAKLYLETSSALPAAATPAEGDVQFDANGNPIPAERMGQQGANAGAGMPANPFVNLPRAAQPQETAAQPERTKRTAPQRRSRETTAVAQPAAVPAEGQPATPADTNSAADLLSKNNEDIYYEIDLELEPKEYKKVVLDKPVFFLDEGLRPQSFTLTIGWVQNAKDPYECQAFTDTVAVSEESIESIGFPANGKASEKNEGAGAMPKAEAPANEKPADDVPANAPKAAPESANEGAAAAGAAAAGG